MLRHIPMVRCESCLREYAETEMVRVPEDDEGGMWLVCVSCYAGIEDCFDEMEAKHDSR